MARMAPAVKRVLSVPEELCLLHCGNVFGSSRYITARSFMDVEKNKGKINNREHLHKLGRGMTSRTAHSSTVKDAESCYLQTSLRKA